MNFDAYQKEAERTDNSSAGIEMPALGLAGEVGEVIELIKKAKYHNCGMDLIDLRSELGDVLWYVATLASRYGLSLQAIAARNVEKLKTRYPRGYEHGGGQR